MTTLQPPDPAGWATTGVDLKTRRFRVLWGLAAPGRTAEQRQFQARYQAFMEVDQALADGYVQARYQHIIISLTTPGWPQRSDAPHRRRDPQAPEHRTSMEVDPPVNRIQTGDELEMAADPLRSIRRLQVAHMLDQGVRERRLAALRPKGGPPPGDV
jgi:hypothetical protein